MWPFKRKRDPEDALDKEVEDVLEQMRNLPALVGPAMQMSQFFEDAPEPVDEPEWAEPTDAEREWARATMPGKATGHIMGWRTWGVTDVLGKTEVDNTNTEDLLSLSSADCWNKLFSIYREIEQLRSKPMYRLRSVSMTGYQWPTQDPVVAIDENDRSGLMHSTLKLAHGPGVYAYKHEPPGKHKVWGKVALWGDVIEHDRGYRARYAYPVELWVNDPKADVLTEHLSKAYGVACHVAGYDDTGQEDRMQQLYTQMLMRQHQMQAQADRIRQDQMQSPLLGLHGSGPFGNLRYP